MTSSQASHLPATTAPFLDRYAVPVASSDGRSTWATKVRRETTDDQ